MVFDLESHHAYILEGVFEALREPLVRRLEEAFGLSAAGNPDFFILEHAVFGIDEARELAERASRRPVAGGRQVFVIGVSGLTREAQNALLKLFEEPGVGTHFFLVVPTAEVLLPTLRSRAALFDAREIGAAASDAYADEIPPEAFLESLPGRRLEILKSLITAKDAPCAARFLASIERALHARSGEMITHENVFYFETLARCRSYLRDRSPSVKMILEYIVAVLPRYETHAVDNSL
ncbi:MAG: hypothetical protein Q8R39_00745 [bacterium]|nr:hypothetical protein [bacterium]MDZ4285275.1 hypothetical protein [Patescibacteria group bacterium]